MYELRVPAVLLLLAQCAKLKFIHQVRLDLIQTWLINGAEERFEKVYSGRNTSALLQPVCRPKGDPFHAAEF